MFFFMKEPKGAILSQNHRRSQGARGLSIEIPPMTIKKALFLHFQFFLASLRTTVHAYNIN